MVSTCGVADVVFCIDASGSMEPCIEGVRTHISDFVSGLCSQLQIQWDLRFDFVAHSCGQGGAEIPLFRHSSVYHDDVHTPLYESGKQDVRLFTKDIDEFSTRLKRIKCEGNEASLIGLDFALDFPWRPASQCHRIVILLTDEPLEGGVMITEQKVAISRVIEKIQKLRVMLFLVAPISDGFEELATVDKSEYQVIQENDGLASVDFSEVLGCIGKSVSVATLQDTSSANVERGLFGQKNWGSSRGIYSGH